MFGNVVIGVGDRDAGHDALALARQLVSAEGGLTLVRVQVVARKPSVDSGLVREAQEQQRDVEALLSFREEARVDAGVAVVKGFSVARGLHAFARHNLADLLVVGASRVDEVERVLIENDTRAVLRDAPCAVAVAPVGYASLARPLREVAIAYDGSRASDRALEVARGVAAESHAKLSAVEPADLPVALRDPWDPQELERVEPAVDLFVIGAPEQSAIDRFLRVSTSETLAEHPESPLIVVPPPSTDAA
jgi:nucleotide-binding universal stress UspA family protein